MISKAFTVFMLLFSHAVFSQKVEFVKLGEDKIDNVSIDTYALRIYNNTDKPICIPVSSDFAYRMSVRDTLELGDVYNEKDSVITVSLFWSKEDLKMDPQQVPSYPVILNPRTYLLTNIKFIKKPGTKEAYFEFRHSFGPQLDYEKIMSDYNTEPKFMWRKSLKFIEIQVPLNI